MVSGLPPVASGNKGQREKREINTDLALLANKVGSDSLRFCVTIDAGENKLRGELITGRFLRPAFRRFRVRWYRCSVLLMSEVPDLVKEGPSDGKDGEFGCSPPRCIGSHIRQDARFRNPVWQRHGPRIIINENPFESLNHRVQGTAVEHTAHQVLGNRPIPFPCYK